VFSKPPKPEGGEQQQPETGVDKTQDAAKKEEQPQQPVIMRKIPPRRYREFFIKWKHLSYWHCSWTSEVRPRNLVFATK